MKTTSEARERVETYGASACSDIEIVATLVGCSEVKAAEILEAVGGLVGLGSAVPEEIRVKAKVSRALAARLVAAVTLARRVASTPCREPMREPAALARFLRAQWGHEEREHFIVVGLDARQRVKMVRAIAIGSLAQVDVHPREVFRPLIREGCHSALIAHNHPTGDPEPSAADISLTQRLMTVAQVTGIPILDHVVFTETSYVSFAERGLMGGER